MFVIPAHPVTDILQLLGVRDRAGLLSEEYIITDLPRYLFDAIEL
jgi:hypothetical protein